MAGFEMQFRLKDGSAILVERYDVPDDHEPSLTRELVAKRQGTIVGALWLALPEDPTSEPAFISGLMVADQWRRKGVGTALMSAVLFTMKAMAGVPLEVTNADPGVQAFFGKFGGVALRHDNTVTFSWDGVEPPLQPE